MRLRQAPGGGAAIEVNRWALSLPFSPSSSSQVLKYLKYRKYPIPKKRTGEETTGKEELSNLMDKLELEGIVDPAFEQILTARKLAKGIGYLYDTFLGADGRMHPEATLLPETGRTSYRRPNFQNQPQGRNNEKPWDLVEKRVAKAIRSTVIATPGYKLVELDWNSMEALLLSYFAKDPDYARISVLSSHAYLLSHYLGKPTDLSWDDKRIKAYHEELKKGEKAKYQICKIANLSDNYDIGVDKLAKVLKTNRPGAQAMKDLRKAAFPKIAEWQMATRLQAHAAGKLVNPFGFTAYFWNIFEKRKDGKWKKGQQAHECLAFMPQSTNAMMMRDVIVDLAALPGYGEYFFLLVPIHDALLLEIREDKVEEVVQKVKALMMRAWAELEGLRVGVDVVVGTNWGAMEALKEED